MDSGIPISYIFDASIDNQTRSLIRLSVDFWSNFTCIKFLEGGNIQPVVRFFQGQGCYSQLGKLIGYASQDISIGQGCENFGVITHEIGHALGVWHQQSRPDRDDSITVLLEKVDPSWRSQYYKQFQTKSYGVGYDWGSVMHYTAYQNHGDVIVMLPTDQRYLHTMGNHYGPVFSDLLAVNSYYFCQAQCYTYKFLNCKNKGFQSSKNCNVCICPNGFGGVLCSERASGEGGAPHDCGETVQADTHYKVLSGSVSIETNKVADRSAGCHYHIQAPEGKRIEIKILSISGVCSVDCCYGSLNVKIEDLTNVGIRLCCNSHIQEIGTMVSAGNLAVLSHYSQLQNRHFSIQFKIYEKPEPTPYDTTTQSAVTSTAHPLATFGTINCRDTLKCMAYDIGKLCFSQNPILCPARDVYIF
uniref:Zinc metalloproteinase n=1 Tax=Ditylenchus dipsaci TaxID=166011 RepID=A0A915CKW1_9BILA